MAVAETAKIALAGRNVPFEVEVHEGFDFWVDDFRWSPDSQSLIFAAQVRAAVPGAVSVVPAFGLSLAPHDTLETLIAFHGLYDRFAFGDVRAGLNEDLQHGSRHRRGQRLASAIG